MENSDAKLSLPYGDIFYPLLQSIHQALWYCFEFEEEQLKKEKEDRNYKRLPLTEEDPRLGEFFLPFGHIYKKGTNKHLTKGLVSPKTQKKHSIYPRLCKLIIQSFNETKKSKFQTYLLPSPIFILFQALVVPSEPQTAAYPLVMCRSILFIFLGLHPAHPDIEHKPKRNSKYPHLESVSEKEILESISSFRNYSNIQARWPDKRPAEKSKQTSETKASRINFLVGNFLAMKGFAHLWFSKRDEIKNFCRFPSDISFDDVKRKYRVPDYRFRLAENLVELPEHGEIINSLFGLPLPIRGADILFSGGIKKSSSGGIVVNLSGRPGAGKTSICLSLAALLSPFNTTCIYISLEEDREDLFGRLISLTPDYLKELSIYNDPKSIDDNNWFGVTKVSKKVTTSLITDMLAYLSENLNSKKRYANDSSNAVPSVCPLYVVIDNINEIVAGYEDNAENYNQMEEFIYQCRKMGAVVILISAEGLPPEIRLDYLVDVSIQVHQHGTDSHKEKPVRILKLTKTRHQISRQGSHIFHLSGSGGFRVSPQIPSQMDKKEIFKRLLPDKSKIIATLNVIQNEETKSYSYRTFLNIFPRSLILIHGYGSSGKAGLALKILLTPALPFRFSKGNESGDIDHYYKNELLVKKRHFGDLILPRKVLIVSFLYPKEYYYDLIYERLAPTIKKVYTGLKRPPSANVIAYSPGFLTAEDFINRIVRYLDEAILEGEPYTGILLDGLHNVLLQFKNLQENDMVWPLLYNILFKYNITTITTFTNFSISSFSADQDSPQRNKSNLLSIEDQLLMQKGQTPFLHSLVKASDFYLVLEEKSDREFKKHYQISVRSAIDQSLPTSILEWDKKSLEVINSYDNPFHFDTMPDDAKALFKEVQVRKS